MHYHKKLYETSHNRRTIILITYMYTNYLNCLLKLNER